MDMRAAFPSKYLSVPDLGGQPQILTMSHVEMEELGQDDKKETKPILHFQGMDKGMVLNKTNNDMLIMIYGHDSAGWTGRQIELYEIQTSYQGQPKAGLRVRVPTRQINPEPAPAPAPMAAQPAAQGIPLSQQATQPAQAAPAVAPAAAPFTDEIPF